MINKKQNGLSKVFFENFLAVWFLVAVSLIFIFAAKQDVLANFVWQKYRNANIAIFLIHDNANLAMLIGNYYFNGVIGSAEYNLDIAEKAFKKAVRVNPKILWGHYQLARIYFMKSNYAQALGEVKKELEANPENLRSLYVRGLIYGYKNQAGDLEKAEWDFLRFTQWAPKEWAGYNDLAWILSKQEKYGEAEKTIKQAFKEAPGADTNPWLWNTLGVAELNLKKYSGAADSFKKAQELAENLTQEEWRRSYPGNNPAVAKEGLSAFLKAIGENLRRANLRNFEGVD